MEAEYLNRIVDTCAVGKKRPRWRKLMASRRRRYRSFLDELPDNPRNFEPASLNELDADERSVDAEVQRGYGVKPAKGAWAWPAVAPERAVAAERAQRVAVDSGCQRAPAEPGRSAAGGTDEAHVDNHWGR
jgi:hypothetical protein